MAFARASRAPPHGVEAQSGLRHHHQAVLLARVRGGQARELTFEQSAGLVGALLADGVLELAQVQLVGAQQRRVAPELRVLRVQRPLALEHVVRLALGEHLRDLRALLSASELRDDRRHRGALRRRRARGPADVLVRRLLEGVALDQEARGVLDA